MVINGIPCISIRLEKKISSGYREKDFFPEAVVQLLSLY
jgi:hypothetical protein